MDRLFGFAALFGLLISCAVHIASLIGINVSQHIPGIFLLHIGVFIVFIPFVLASQKTLGRRPSWSQLGAVFPTWSLLATCILMLYVLINFALFSIATEGGSPSIVDGKYLLSNHGKLIRELSFAEFNAFKANEIRGFSGHWLLFYFVPCAYFLFRRRTANIR